MRRATTTSALLSIAICAFVALSASTATAGSTGVFKIGSLQGDSGSDGFVIFPESGKVSNPARCANPDAYASEPESVFPGAQLRTTLALTAYTTGAMLSLLLDGCTPDGFPRITAIVLEEPGK